MIGNCVKTGAIVNFSEWGTTIPCDLFAVEDSIVVTFRPDYFHAESRRDVTHNVYVGTVGFMDKKRGIAVVPKINVQILEAK